MKKKNILILAIAAVVIIAAGIVTAVVAKSGHVNIEAQLSLGERYLAEQDYEKAVLAFTKVIDADPMNADAYMGRAKAYAGLGQLENARADFDQCLEIDGSHLADRYLEYGKWLESIGLLEEAQKIFEEGYKETGDERILAEIKRLMGEDASVEEESSGAESSGEGESSGEESSAEEINDSFTASDRFVPFEEIPEEDQTMIRLLIEDLIQGKSIGDFAESIAYLESYDSAAVACRTVYEGWKIEYYRYRNPLSDGYRGDPGIYMEIREENGRAYSYNYGYDPVGQYYEILYRSSTVNWQVNGEVVSAERHFAGSYADPVYDDDSLPGSITGSGQIKENIYIGDKFTYNSSDAEPMVDTFAEDGYLYLEDEPYYRLYWDETEYLEGGETDEYYQEECCW